MPQTDDVPIPPSPAFKARLVTLPVSMWETMMARWLADKAQMEKYGFISPLTLDDWIELHFQTVLYGPGHVLSRQWAERNSDG